MRQTPIVLLVFKRYRTCNFEGLYGIDNGFTVLGIGFEKRTFFAFCGFGKSNENRRA